MVARGAPSGFRYVPLLERIAGGDRSVLEAALEPLHALGGTSVGESFGIDRASGHALDAIVADCGGGLQA